MSGELPVGDELPTEKQLTEHFAVSRSTIREAVRILQAQGLLSGGDTVSTARPRVSIEQTFTRAGDALENAVRLGQVPLGDLIELRLLLEGGAVTHDALVAERIVEARDALEVMRDPEVTIDAFHEADVRFHICLAGSGGNLAFPLVMTVLRDAIAEHLLGALEAMEDPRPTLARLAAEHAAILDAVEAGEGERARSLLRSHIWDFYANELPGAG